MFESLETVAEVRRRSAATTAVSLALHGAAIAIAASVPIHRARIVQQGPEGIYVVLKPRQPQAAAPDRRSAPAAAPKPKRKLDAPIARSPRLIVPQAVMPTPEPPAADRPPPEEPERAHERGFVAALGAAPGAGLPSIHGTGPPEYEPGTMTAPQRLSGPDPEYTHLARANAVQGTMVVKCIVTIQGEVRRCRIVESLPFMDAAVIDALEQRRYTPARLADGRAVEVDYIFRIRLQLR